MQSLTNIPAKFKKDPVKLQEELRSLDTQCIHALVEVEQKNLLRVVMGGSGIHYSLTI